MCPQGIGHLRLAAAAIEVPERRTSRVEALAQPCLDTLEALFAEVADGGGGHHGLAVGRPAADRTSVVYGKRGSDRVQLCGRSIIKKKNYNTHQQHTTP